MSSRARLLQTKFDRLNSEANADLLQMTVEEKEKRLHYNLQEAENYKQKMLRTQVCFYRTDPPCAPTTTRFCCEYMHAKLVLPLGISHCKLHQGQPTSCFAKVS